MAANIFTGATNNNWGTSTNWSLGAVPTASDGNPATFDATSPNCTVNTSNRVCNGLNFTGYTNTITMSFNVTCAGSITLASTMGVSGSGVLGISSSGTITSNGKTWPNAFTVTTSGVTITLADNWNIDGTLTTNNGIFNGNTINAGGNLSVNTGGFCSGTTNLILDGTGTWSASGTPGELRLNLTINTAGTITLNNGGAVAYGTGTFTYTAGTVVTTNCNFAVTATNGGTYNTNGIQFDQFSITSGTTITLNSLFYANAVTFSDTSNLTFNGTAGFSFNTFTTSALGNRTVTLQEGITYTIRSGITNTGSTNASRFTITSNHAANVTYLTLNQGGTCSLGYLNATRVDSSGGRTIRTFNGTLTTTTNWQSFSDLTTHTSTF